MVGLGVLLIVCTALVRKLRKNRPNIKKQLEIFAAPLIKKIEKEVPKEVIEIIREEEHLLVPEKVEQIIDNIIDPNWFDKQKTTALAQLKQFKLNNIQFIPDWTFTENGQTYETRGYLLDATTTLNDLVEKIFKKKQRVVFYLSQDSDGIYHKRLTSHSDSGIVTVQTWCSEN